MGVRGSIPDSVPVTSLVGKIEGERKTPREGRGGKGAKGEGIAGTLRVSQRRVPLSLSDGAATATAAAAGGCYRCRWLIPLLLPLLLPLVHRVKRRVAGGRGGGGLYPTPSPTLIPRERASFSKSTDRSRPSSSRVVAADEYASLELVEQVAVGDVSAGS